MVWVVVVPTPTKDPVVPNPTLTVATPIKSSPLLATYKSWVCDNGNVPIPL